MGVLTAREALVRRPATSFPRTAQARGAQPDELIVISLPPSRTEGQRRRVALIMTNRSRSLLLHPRVRSRALGPRARSRGDSSSSPAISPRASSTLCLPMFAARPNDLPFSCERT